MKPQILAEQIGMGRLSPPISPFELPRILLLVVVVVGEIIVFRKRASKNKYKPDSSSRWDYLHLMTILRIARVRMNMYSR